MASEVVRTALPEQDAAACLRIYAPYVEHTAVSFEDKVPDLPEFADRIAAAHEWLVLADGGTVAGYAYAAAHRARAAYRWAADVSVYVATEYQRAGVARRLYGELFERLVRRGFRVACAGVTLPNDASVGLHTAMGFRPVGVYQGIGWKAGKWHDVGWFQRELTPVTDATPAEPLPREP